MMALCTSIRIPILHTTCPVRFPQHRVTGVRRDLDPTVAEIPSSWMEAACSFIIMLLSEFLLTSPVRAISL